MGRPFELDPPGSVPARIIEATQTLCERQGATATSIDQIAQIAGVSRATVYRHFPGGRADVFEAHRRWQLIVFFEDLRDDLGRTDTVEDALVQMMWKAACLLRNETHLHWMLEHEPGQVLPLFTFRGLDRILALCRRYLAPGLVGPLDRRTADRTTELCARLVLQHLLSADPPFDLTNRAAVRRLVRTRIVPGLPVLASHASSSTASTHHPPARQGTPT